MDENASEAITMAFALFVFVIALSTAMYLFSKVTETADTLTYYVDETNFYDNVEVLGTEGIERYVNTETIIPTLYRYYKENFCVKIYDTTGCAIGSTVENPVLVQILDVNLEEKVNAAASDTNAEDEKNENNSTTIKRRYALRQVYNNTDKFYDTTTEELDYIYMFGAPWLDTTENMKLRVDYFINGQAGYINNKYVDYTSNPFSEMIALTKIDQGYQFKELFNSYSYSGSTMTTEDGDVLITDASSKDKVVITYTLVYDDTINN